MFEQRFKQAVGVYFESARVSVVTYTQFDHYNKNNNATAFRAPVCTVYF